MKKLFISFIFSFAILNISAQELNGVGNFKIGMDIENFLKLAEIQSLNSKDLSFNSDLNKNTSDIFKNTHQLNNRLNIIHSPDVIDFYFMTDLGISGDWGNWYPTSIRFYKNKLVSISIKNTTYEFGKLISEKYGKPKISGGIKKTICQNKYGAQTQEFDGQEKWIWGTGNAIQATLTKWAFCGTYYNNGVYTLEHAKIVAIVNSEELTLSKIKEKEELKNKISSSKL